MGKGYLLGEGLRLRCGVNIRNGSLVISRAIGERFGLRVIGGVIG